MPKLDTIVSIKPEPDDKGRRKGIVRPRIDDEPWRRRKLQHQKYLNVYDMARSANGSDLPFGYNYDSAGAAYYTPFGTSFWTPLTGNAFIISNPPAYTADWNNYLLSTDPEDLASSRKNITEDLADDYNISIDPLDTYVPGQGLAIPEEITFLKGSASSVNRLKWMMVNQPYFPYWLDMTVPTAGVPLKTTKEPSYSAASELLVVDRSIDVFLAPARYIGSGEARDYPLASSTFPYLPQTWYWAVGQSQLLPRTTIGDPDWDTIWANRANLHSQPQDVKEDVLGRFINNGSGDLVTAIADTHIHPGPTQIDFSNISVGGAGFPLESDGTQNRIAVSHDFFLQGQLVAIIRKHLPGGEFEFYYMWVNAGAWGAVGWNITSNLRV